MIRKGITVTVCAHSPTLDTLKRIEKTIMENNGEFSKTQLWKNLPKKMMYQTFKKALTYLVESNKVIIAHGKVVWAFNPDLFNQIMEKTKEASDFTKASE